MINNSDQLYDSVWHSILPPEVCTAFHNSASVHVRDEVYEMVYEPLWIRIEINIRGYYRFLYENQ